MQRNLCAENMKTYLSILLNWRVLILAALSVAAAILILGESDDMQQLLTTKGIGLCIAGIIYHLGKYWNAKGKINELMSLAEEE